MVPDTRSYTSEVMQSVNSTAQATGFLGLEIQLDKQID